VYKYVMKTLLYCSTAVLRFDIRLHRDRLHRKNAREIPAQNRIPTCAVSQKRHVKIRLHCNRLHRKTAREIPVRTRIPACAVL
jgi:hypothetical protein